MAKKKPVKILKFMGPRQFMNRSMEARAKHMLWMKSPERKALKQRMAERRRKRAAAMTRLPWGHKSRHCIYCGNVGPRTIVAGGYAHKYCIPKESKAKSHGSARRSPTEARRGPGRGPHRSR